jgi:hypothetical protein
MDSILLGGWVEDGFEIKMDLSRCFVPPAEPTSPNVRSRYT